MTIGFSAFAGRFRPKPLPGTALYSTTTNRSGPVLKYDDQSGNLYTEETFRSPKHLLEVFEKPTHQERKALYRRYPRTNFDKKEKSLYNLCRKLVLEYVDSLTPDVLSCLHWYYGKQIWEDLIDCRADSFDIFKNFCEVYGHEPDFHPGNRELCITALEAPSSRRLILPTADSKPWTPLYIPLLESKSASWLVNLTIMGDFDLLELIELNGLSNLLSLSLHFPNGANHRLLGRVFKSWATNKDRFSNLRVLHLSNFPGTVNEIDRFDFGILAQLNSLKLIQLRFNYRWMLPRKTTKCRYFAKAEFVIAAKGKWRVFCGAKGDDCVKCFPILQKDEELLKMALEGEPSKIAADARIKDTGRRLIEESRILDGRRRIIVDVTPGKNGLQMTDGWVCFYRKGDAESVASTVEPLDSNGKRKLSDMDPSMDVNPTKCKKERAFKTRLNKKQDMASLLGSFM